MAIGDIRETPPQSSNIVSGSQTLNSYGSGADKYAPIANLQALPRIAGALYYGTDTGLYYIDNGVTLETVAQVEDFEVYFTPGSNTAETDMYSVRVMGNNGSTFFSFEIPYNFESVTSMEVLFFPANTRVGANIDIISAYGAVGEDRLANQESDLTTTYSYTANELSSIDVSPVFTGVAADDICGLEIDNSGGGSINVIGLRLRYV